MIHGLAGLARLDMEKPLSKNDPDKTDSLSPRTGAAGAASASGGGGGGGDGGGGGVSVMVQEPETSALNPPFDSGFIWPFTWPFASLCEFPLQRFLLLPWKQKIEGRTGDV